jgi:hypothetical protein
LLYKLLYLELMFFKKRSIIDLEAGVNIFILSRKQLLYAAIMSLVSEVIITGLLLLLEYMDWLDARAQIVILWVVFPLIALAMGWLSRQWTGNWFVALLVPLLVFSAFYLMVMDSYVFLAFVPLELAASLGGYYLLGLIRKRSVRPG